MNKTSTSCESKAVMLGTEGHIIIHRGLKVAEGDESTAPLGQWKSLKLFLSLFLNFRIE